MRIMCICWSTVQYSGVMLSPYEVCVSLHGALFELDILVDTTIPFSPSLVDELAPQHAVGRSHEVSFTMKYYCTDQNRSSNTRLLMKFSQLAWCATRFRWLLGVKASRGGGL